MLTRFVLTVAVATLVLGAAVAPADASSFVKRGASGHAYYWTNGC